MTRKTGNKTKRTTLRDVANYTNVSPMTVSNVVNGKLHSASKETIEKIEKAIKKLNYLPSATSRKLRSSREFSVGMVVMYDEPTYLVNPFVNHLVAGLSNHLSENNYTLTIQGAHPSRFESSSIFTIAGTDAMCAILCGPDIDRRKNIQHMLRMHQPVVIFQDTLSGIGRSNDIAVINQDDEEGGYLIASHVLSKGARKLFFLQSLMEWPAVERRKKGVMSAVKKTKNATCEVMRYAEEDDFSVIQKAVDKYFLENGKPDAIIGATDIIAIAALRYCQSKGYSVPENIMVTGFNGFASSQYTTPPLTTIKSPAYEMGQYAGSLILERLDSKKFAMRETKFPVTYVQGGSA